MSELSPKEKTIRAETWHPGCFLKEEMLARKWTAEDVAEKMGGVSHKERIIDGLVVMAICGEIILQDDADQEIGEETAAKLGKAFGTSAEFWLNLDRAWREPATTRHRYLEDAPP